MIEFHAREMGQGPTLLFLHGFMGSGEDWLPVLERLSSQFHCVAIDLPGHGKTRCDRPELFSMERTAEHVVAWVLEHQLQCQAIVGYSMGARLSLYGALRFPHCFPQAVIESGSPGLINSKDRKARRDIDLARSHAIEADFLSFLRNWYQQPLFTSLWKHSYVFEEMQRRRLCNDPIGLARSLREMGTGQQPNLWPLLSLHTDPLLFLTGEFDQKFTRINRGMNACCQTARHEVVPGVGHNIHLENPGAIAYHIQQFLTLPNP